MGTDICVVIRTPLDCAAIGDLILRHRRALGRRDRDEVASCFAPDEFADCGIVPGIIDEVVASIR